jgi:hypothetical protein
MRFIVEVLERLVNLSVLPNETPSQITLAQQCAKKLAARQDWRKNVPLLPAEMLRLVQLHRLARLRQLSEKTQGDVFCPYKFARTETIIRIPCRNSFERLWVHKAAEELRLVHGRYGEWDAWQKDLHMDYRCRCRWCWRSAGQKAHRVAGVWVSSDPATAALCTRKDKQHRREALGNKNGFRSPKPCFSKSQ